jgi:PAS domain S-box-containing protein
VVDEQQANNIQNEEQYQAFIRNSNEGIWRIDLEKPILTSLKPETQIKHFYKYAYLAENNEAMAKMYGFRSPKSMTGMRLGDLMIESDPANHEFLRAFIESGYTLSGVESHEQDKKGRDKYFLNSLVGIVEDGYLTRAWGTQQDVTSQKAATEALLRSEERLSLALQASSMGLWEWEVLTDKLYWSPELRKIFGIRPHEVMTYEKYVQMIHPEDRKHAEEVAYHSMQTGETYQFEHRIVRRDGSMHWLLGTGRAYLENGKPVRMVGTSVNINAVKQAQELRMVNTQLKSQRAQLLALSRAKDEFIALASHQLRTPATAVKQYISLLMDEMAGPVSERQHRFLKIAFDSNERELRIISDLLKTAQIDSNLYTLDTKKHDFTEVVRFTTDELETTLDLKKQTVVVKGLKSVPLTFDMAEMKLVLVNLLENASKYSHQGGKIVIHLRHTGKYLEVSVTDKGVGIKAQDINRIFDKFTRVDNELSDTVMGTGLGLYWAKRIVDLHGGSIEVVSEVGHGSSFTVRLPHE